MTEEKSVIATTASNIVFDVIMRFTHGDPYATIDAAVEAHLAKLVALECAK